MIIKFLSEIVSVIAHNLHGTFVLLFQHIHYSVRILHITVVLLCVNQ